MSPLFFVVTIVLVLCQVVLPRRVAFLPLLIGACHLGNVEILGQLTLTRMLILVGLIRAVASGHFAFSRREPLDALMVLFCGVAVLSGFAHEADGGNPFTFRAGLAFNIAGTYLYARAYIIGPESFMQFAKCLTWVLVPLALFMAAEQATGKNFYASVGARTDAPAERQGRLRAQGPFGHSILAGTAGAASVPLIMILWRTRRSLAITGLVAAGLITLSSASSGPIATGGIAAAGLYLWRRRGRLRGIIFGGVVLLVLAQLWMMKPAWFLMAKIDLIGGSTGWHRATLIDRAFRHLDEWWLAGTDYTRHWMRTGVGWSSNHTDLTNYYIHLGVIGGLPLVLLLIAMIWKSIGGLGRAMKNLREYATFQEEFMLWCVSTAIFAHSITFLSISYFGQMYVLFYMIVGAVPGLIQWSRLALAYAQQEEQGIVPDESPEIRPSPSLA